MGVFWSFFCSFLLLLGCTYLSRCLNLDHYLDYFGTEVPFCHIRKGNIIGFWIVGQVQTSSVHPQWFLVVFGFLLVLMPRGDNYNFEYVAQFFQNLFQIFSSCRYASMYCTCVCQWSPCSVWIPLPLLLLLSLPVGLCVRCRCCVLFFGMAEPSELFRMQCPELAGAFSLTINSTICCSGMCGVLSRLFGVWKYDCFKLIIQTALWAKGGILPPVLITICWFWIWVSCGDNPVLVPPVSDNPACAPSSTYLPISIFIPFCETGGMLTWAMSAMVAACR